MRPILSAIAYARVLQGLSPDKQRQAADAIGCAAQELMARHGLHRAIFLCGDALREIGTLAAKQMEAAEIYGDEGVMPPLEHALICDLLFASETKTAVKAMADSGCPVLSVGVPSGVDPDTGRAAALAVHAEITVAPFGYLVGLFLHDGLDHCGEILPIKGEAEEGLLRFEAEDAHRLLSPRKRTAHKGDSGKALLCVGSPKYVGAALLSARACLAAGCGILFVACPDVVREALWRLPEAIGIPIGMAWNGENCRIALESMEGMQAVGLGCGVGDGDVSPLIEAALQKRLPLVLDADGLNCLSRNPELVPLLHERVVLTPHPGEMSRLTGLPTSQVLDDPIAKAKEWARRWGCTVLLKGAATVVSDGKRTCLVAEGNAGLGKGGSGDVLTGIITGLLCQGIEPFWAACLGSYLLGTSAKKAFELLKERMLRASHVIEALEDWNE